MQSLLTAWKKITHDKRALVLLLILCVFSVFYPVFTHADDRITGYLTQMVGWLVETYVTVVGAVMLALTNLVIDVAAYNSFGDATAVTIGWILMRDITNMLFVVLLLLMAFGTLLDQGQKLGDYKSLPKLAVIAIVVNFSKMITLFIIDIGQVVMLSFVVAFQQTAGGNFIKAFGIQDWFRLGTSGKATTALMGYILVAVLVTVACAVIMVFLAYLILRVALLWILIIFAPIAFALKLVPSRGNQYYGKWWEYLVTTIITGPLLAFFLWLTLLVAGVSTGGIGTEVLADASALRDAQQAEMSLAQAATKGSDDDDPAVLEDEKLLTFFITTLMLLLGLKITTEMGGAIGGAVAGKGLGYLRSTGRGAVNLAKKGALGGAKRLGRVVAHMPISKEGGSLAGYASATKDKIKQSKAGRMFGLDKDYTEKIRKQREARARRNMGDERGAQRIEEELLSKEKSSLSGLKQPELKKIVRNAKAGSVEQKAAALELAQQGFFKNNEHSIDLASGGDDDFRKRLIRETNAKGGNIQDVKNEAEREKAVKKDIAGMTEGKKRATFMDLKDQFKMVVSIDGKERMAGKDGMAIAKNIDADFVNDNKKMNDTQRQEVLDGLLLGMRNTTGAEQTALMEKYNQIVDGRGGTQITLDPKGVATGDANALKTQNELYQEQSKEIAEAQSVEYRREDGNISASHKHIANATSKMSKSDRQHVRGAIVPYLQGIMEQVGTGEIADHGEAATEVENITKQLRQRYDNLGLNSGEFRDDGTEKTWSDAFNDSPLKAKLDEFAETLNLRDNTTDTDEQEKIDETLKEMQRTIAAMTQDLMRGRSAGLVAKLQPLRIGSGFERSRQESTAKYVKENRKKGDASLTAAKSTPVGSEREKELRLARRAGLKSVGKMLGTTGFSGHLPIPLLNKLPGLNREMHVDVDIPLPKFLKMGRNIPDNIRRRMQELRERLQQYDPSDNNVDELNDLFNELKALEDEIKH